MLFHVLGPVEAHSAGEDLAALRAGKPVAVLATLLRNANAWVRTDALIAATWPQVATPSSADANLKTYIWQLRRALPPAADGARIDSRPGAYRLRVQPGELDADRAEELAGSARRALAAGDHADAARQFTEALRLWRGEPFEGVPDASDDGTVAWLGELRWELRSGLAESLAGLGRTREAIAVLRVLTDQDPLREGPWAHWMRVLCAAGRHHAALAVYDRVRSILVGELGAEPGPQLREAHLLALRAGEVREVSAVQRQELPRDLPDFTGRAAELARLAAVADQASTCVPVAVLDGMPGVGKTALAVHAAHRLAGSFPDGQLFVDLGAHAGPAQTLARLLAAVGVPRAEVPAGLAERAARWRAELAGRRMLLVLDDAGCAEQVRPLLPGRPGSAVLVTTRSRVFALDGITSVTVDPLSTVDAADLFRVAAADWRADVESAAVAEVARRCGGLPVAVRAAAARLRSRPSWTVERLAARLVDDRGPAELGQVTGLFATAFRPLADRPRRALAALAAHPGNPTATELATVLATAAQPARQAAEDLVDRHLATPLAGDRFGLHPAVRDAALRTLKSCKPLPNNAIEHLEVPSGQS